MEKNDIKILDCTLRDGGYVNNWNWGFQRARNIIKFLVKANVDIVEVGFLRNIEGYDENVTVCNTIEELNRLLPESKGNTMFSGMAMRSDYDIKKLSHFCGSGIEMLRITAHDYDIAEGMDFACEVKDKGYKLSINPINIMGYSDDRILWLIEHINKIQPYQFSIVDTFGSMKRRDLDRITSLVDNNIDRNIRIGLHLHENMAISCQLAQTFIDKHLTRPTSVDASLMGIGRIPGNLPIELFADYLNDYTDSIYDIDYMLDAIQDYIAPIKGATEWGYTPAYFLSARFNLHRNYAEHYLKKGDLTHRDINKILSQFDPSKKTSFDIAYADVLYEDYKDQNINDTDDWSRLKNALKEKDILILAPGTSLIEHDQLIQKHITTNNPIIISVNFTPEKTKIDYAFFSNGRRYSQAETNTIKSIVTSNIQATDSTYKLNYNKLSIPFSEGCNAFIMLLKMLRDMEVNRISAAGADGYLPESNNYYDSKLQSNYLHANKFNLAVINAIRNLNINVDFITPSMYEPK